MNDLNIQDMISNSLKLGIQNAASLIGAVLLWLLTIWIPYLNVGTTIALFGGNIIEMSKGKVISPLEIFDSKYRKNMGEIFLLWGFMVFGIYAGMLFLIIPGYVIAIAWSLALPLLIEKKLSPIDALMKSNELTYGKKWTIFFGSIIVSLVVMFAGGILAYIFSLIDQTLGAIIMIIVYLIFISIMISLSAYIYGVLTQQGSQTQDIVEN